MPDHWHIVYLANSCEEVMALFEQAGMPVRFPAWNPRYPGVVSEAFAYVDAGKGAISNVGLDCPSYQDNSWLRSLRQLVPPEAQTKVVLVTGDKQVPSACFSIWQQQIQHRVTIVAACPTCGC